VHDSLRGVSKGCSKSSFGRKNQRFSAVQRVWIQWHGTRDGWRSEDALSWPPRVHCPLAGVQLAADTIARCDVL